jgi:hypothetical protein
MTLRHTTQDSSERVIGPMQRSLPDNTQHWQETESHARDGIRAHNSRKRTAADPRLRPYGYWDRHIFILPLSNLDRML